MSIKTIATLTLILGSGLAAAGAGPHWDYSGVHGPEHWGELAPDYSLCKTGQSQTPIDIVSRVDTDLPPIHVRYKPGGIDEVHNGHTIQVNYEEGSSIVLDGHEYALKQFHFHAPSENHIDGKALAMEAHLVHVDQDGRLAVIAVMFEQGAENLALTNIWAAMPMVAEHHTELTNKVSAEALLPASHDYYRFDGSLTTPPCTEGVAWLVMKHPVSASYGQLTKFARAMGHANNRPLQALNERVVQE